MKTSLVVALLVSLVAACQGTRKQADPVLEIRAEGVRELGVSTDYGLVFLGRSARSGTVEVTAWFGDGPSVERAVVEPLGGGLFTAEPDIRLPRVPISFDTPSAGSKLVVVGREGRERWEADVEVRDDANIEGLVVSIPPQMEALEGQIGAGVYLALDDNPVHRHLVGLISGKVEFTDANGAVRRYLTVVGPDQMWRLVTYKREYPHKRKFVYRDDIL